MNVSMQDLIDRIKRSGEVSEDGRVRKWVSRQGTWEQRYLDDGYCGTLSVGSWQYVYRFDKNGQQIAEEIYKDGERYRMGTE